MTDRFLRRLLAAALALLMVVGLGVSTLSMASSAQAATCPRFILIGARGSGEPASGNNGVGTPVNAVLQALKKKIPDDSASGQRGVVGLTVVYDAANVKVLKPTPTELALIPAGIASGPVAGSLALEYSANHLAPFLSSINQGIANALDELTTEARLCPSARFVLAGYSQGAIVMHQILLKLDDTGQRALLDRISATVLIADGDRKKNLTNAQQFGTASGTAAEGIRSALTVGERDIPSSKASSTIDICTSGDAVCDFSLATLVGFDRAGQIHATSYADSKLNGIAATIATNVVAPLLAPAGPSSPQPSANNCSAFVSDVTMPDNSVVSPGATVTKTWKLRNCGTSNWSTLHAARVSGVFGPTTFAMPAATPGATVNVTTPVTAPTTPGTYRAVYRLQTTQGSYATNSFWVQIVVPAAATRVDCSAFVSDVTGPDGTPVQPGATLTKTWRLRNCGNASWAGLTAVRVSGDVGPDRFVVPALAPGTTGDVSTSVTAPTVAGLHRGTYRLQAADGHYAANSFWIEVSVQAAPVIGRTGITSYDRMAPGAPYHGYFTTAWQPFVTQSNRITYIGVTVGNPRLSAGQPVAANQTIRLCTTTTCAGGAIAQASPQIINYGNTAADLGDIAVTPGRTYYIVWSQPAAAAGNTWVTYWWAGGPGIAQSDQMQAVVRGYNA